MLSRQARERQETADNGQGSEPLGAHPDPLQEEEELEVGRRSSRSRGVTSGMGNLLDGLEHRAEGLEHQRTLLPRVVRAEEQHREGGTGLVPAPKSPPRLWRGAVDDQLLE